MKSTGPSTTPEFALLDPFAGAKPDAFLWGHRAAIEHPHALRQPACWPELQPGERVLVGGLAVAVRRDHATGVGPFDLTCRFAERLRVLADSAGPRQAAWAALAHRLGTDPALGGAMLGIFGRLMQRERYLAAGAAAVTAGR